MDGRGRSNRFENASVDADICIRFRRIKNGGMQKRISVDVALDYIHLQISLLRY